MDQCSNDPLIDDQFNCNHTFSFQNGGYVDVSLARPVYPTGAIVSMSVHSSHDVLITAAGFFRLDPRWHKKKASSVSTPRSMELIGAPISLPPSTQVFWKTATVLCPAVPRPCGPPYQPPPIVLPTLSPPQEDTTTSIPERLAVVRFQLPTNGPPTLIVTSCRYYYSFIIHVVTDTPHMFQVPIPVILTTPSTEPIENMFRDDLHHSNNSMIPKKNITVHSTDTTKLLTPTERQEIEGDWTVIRRPYPHHQPPTLLLEDQGVTVCRLIFVTGFLLSPGGVFRCHAQRLHASCRQLAGHLRGQETVTETKVRARLYSWDTFCCSPMPEETELSLGLPWEVTNTLEIRGVVKITATVEVDLVVEPVPGQFRNLHAEIPCHIVACHDLEEEEEEGDDKGVRDLKVLGLVAIKAREVYEDKKQTRKVTA